MFITYKEIEEAEDARRKRAEQPGEPDPTRVPYYGTGQPSPTQLMIYWQRRALAAEAKLRMYQELEQIRSKK